MRIILPRQQCEYAGFRGLGKKGVAGSTKTDTVTRIIFVIVFLFITVILFCFTQRDKFCQISK